MTERANEPGLLDVLLAGLEAACRREAKSPEQVLAEMEADLAAVSAAYRLDASDNPTATRH